MATSSNSANAAAAAAIDTGGQSTDITGGGSANVRFEGQAPAQQGSNEIQTQPSQQGDAES